MASNEKNDMNAECVYFSEEDMAVLYINNEIHYIGTGSYIDECDAYLEGYSKGKGEIIPIDYIDEKNIYRSDYCDDQIKGFLA